MSHVTVLDTTVQKTNEWLRDIGRLLGIDDRHSEYAALRATLHALRDHLSVDEVAQLGAQLPLAIRGVYYEGWDPKKGARKPRDQNTFLDIVRHELRGHTELWDVSKAVGAVLEVLSKHVSSGEIAQVVRSLPAGIRDLWPRSVI